MGLTRWTADRLRDRLFPIGAGLTFIGLATLAVALIAPGGEDPKQQHAAEGNPVSTARFAALSQADNNRCGMPASELRRMGERERLQGSCCFPMDEAKYEQQLQHLRGYRERAVVPRDPYDIPVTLAKRLLSHRDVALSRAQRAAYKRATQLADLGGPCCCPCWRWQAFKGQARFLLARRGWSAGEVAALWDAEEGCGGPADHA